MPQPEGWERTLDSATGWRKNIAMEDEATQYFQNGSIFRKKAHDRRRTRPSDQKLVLCDFTMTNT